MKIVFSVSDISKWNLVNVNVFNVLEVDPNLEIAVVAFAEAVTVFENPEINLHPKANYYLCNNAIDVRQVDRNKLPKDIQIVSSGVYQILILQEKGYRYIRP